MIEIKEMNKEGYNRVINFGDWTVANLSHNLDTDLERITYFQKHNLTDEVFILLEGQACLVLLEGDKFDPKALKFYSMEKNFCYNIKKNVYHQHILSKDANVCIIENRDTCDDNSPVYYLNEDELAMFRKIAKEKVHV